MNVSNAINPVLKVVLQFLGIWPNVSYSAVYWCGFTSTLIIAQYFQYVYIFHHLKFSEFSNLIEALTATIEYSLTIFKLISLWLYRRVFHQILADMDSDWRECSNVDQHLYLMTINAKIPYFFSTLIYTVSITITAFYLLSDYIIQLIFVNKDHNVTSREFPIKLQFPFETGQSPVFELLFALIFIHVMCHAGIFNVMIGLILTLVMHVSGQVDIMCHEFENIAKQVYLRKCTVSLYHVQIKRHKKIILFAENIEKLFSFISLMQVICNTIVICFLAFFFIISFHNKSDVFILAKIIFAYFAVLCEPFVICLAGEHLSFKGELLANAIYESLWYELPACQNKIIVLMIMRSQKRLAITAGKMMNVSLDTFTNILKASISYISVLNAVY